MNKIYKFSIFVALISLLGCSDYLDVVPDNVATLDHAFHDKYNAERFLYTCYSYIPSHSSENNNPGLNAGDEIWYNREVSERPGHTIARGLQNVDNPVLNFWNGGWGGSNLFIGIRDCNILLENIDQVKELTPKELKRWKAEAKFLKAYFHWYLLRMYGPIHIIDENIPVSAETEEILIRRQPIDECFQYVIDLMDEAAEDLPLAINNVATELGRITQPVAKAMKARVMITYASPLFNGNPDFKTLVDNEGTKLFDNEYDPQKWINAADACREAIEISHEASHRLFQMEDYESRYEISDSTRRRAMLRSIITKRWNPELIWGNSSSTAYSLQVAAQPKLLATEGNPVNQWYAASFRTAEMFYSDNGVPIEEDPSWDYENRYKNITIPEEELYYLEPGEQTAQLNFHREPRFYSSLAFDRGAWYGNGRLSDDKNPWYVHGRVGEAASAAERYAYSVSGYWPKKLVHLDNEISENGGYDVTTYPFPVIRLADLYLMYAEALNEVNGPGAEVYEWIDKIRVRAGLEGVVDSWTKYSVKPTKPQTQSGLRQIIHHERMIELAFEGIRFWDLRRWKRSIEVMHNKQIKGWNVLAEGGPNAYYQVVTHHTQEFVVRDYLWPIKEYELTINPNLVQNPGWN